MLKFVDKKLLLLGSNTGTLDLIRYAKTNGAYTVVADNLPKEKSIGKQFADSCVLISTGDIDLLKDYVCKEKIDGVFAGISEFNLLNAMKLCQELSFPFYCTREQWDSIEDKERFRHLCEKYEIPTPRTYFSGSSITSEEMQPITYPVIVKPVDSNSSIGVCICKNKERLTTAIAEAVSHSDKKRIIVEEFIEGDEFTAHYTIVNNHVSLSCIDNRVPVVVHQGDVTSIPIARIYPSIYIEEYMKQVNEKMIDLCKSLNMKCGVLFVQGLYNKKENRFAIFEAGLRCAGEAPYRILENTNGINFMNNFVDYALLGKVDAFHFEKEDPGLNGKFACVVSFVSKGGIVGSILNYNSIETKVPTIVDKECRYRVGDHTPTGDTLRQIMLRFVLICDTKEELIKDVVRINNTVKVLDTKGEDLCYTFDIQRYYTNSL